jgi:hypothetical protein
MNREMLKEAIAEAKTIKETAIASAKAALEEAFTPTLMAEFANKLNELEEEEVKETKEMADESYGLEEDFNLEEILAELGEGDDQNEGVYEAEDDMDMDDMDMDGDMPSNDDLEMMIKNILDQEIAALIDAGKLEAGDDYKKDEEGKDDEDEVEVDDSEEVSIDELLAEIDSLTKEEKEEMEEGIELPRIGVDKAEYEAMLKDAGITDPNVLQKVLYKFLALATKNKEGETVSLGAKDSVSINREAKEMEETITELRSELNEVNLLNAKLLYTNKIFKSKNLTESEKVKVLNTFDKAETVKEVKLVFETLTESFKTTVKKNPIKESLGSASRTVTAAPKQEQIIEVNDAFARMQRLAGLR